MISAASISHLPPLLDKLSTSPLHAGTGPTIELSPGDVRTLKILAERLQDTDPYYASTYMGHMSSYVHPLASMAYMLAMQLNSNNHSYDGGRATTVLEQECIHELALMFGWASAQGHLCSGGTIANFEALWCARELGFRAVVASRAAHYCHRRAAGILGMDYREVDVDARQRMDLDHVAAILKEHPDSVVVATCGTTAVGAVDPIASLVALAREHSTRLHIDAAYAGYYTLATQALEEDVAGHVRAITAADSVAIDPHKHGMQGFGCGAILFRESQDKMYRHDAPYTYTNDGQSHLGQVSLECSRPGAVAAALWATMRQFPLTTEGVFAARLSSCRRNACAFHDYLLEHPRYRPLCRPDTDIVCLAPRHEEQGRSLRSTVELDVGRLLAAGIHVAMMPLSGNDDESVFCIRCAMMKPEHEAIFPKVLSILATPP